MNVLVDGIVYGFQQYGGINTYFNEILPRIARFEDARVAVLVPQRAIGKSPRFPVLRLTRDPFLLQTGFSWRLDQLLHGITEQANTLLAEWRARSRSDCVFHSTYFTVLKAPVAQVAVVYDMNHERLPEWYQSSWGRWLRRQYRTYVARATRVIAISEQTRRDVIAYYEIPAERIDVTPLAVCSQTFHPDRTMETTGLLASRFRIDRPFFLYVGNRKIGYKNFRPLLVAFAECGLVDKVLLVAVGDAWTDDEQRYIDSLGLTHATRAIVQPNNAVLRNLYSSSLAFIYPSLFEGFGIPLLEAMACETLLVAADTPVFREVAGDAAVYFDPNNPASMARAMQSALDPVKRDLHIQLGRARANQFSWDRCARETYAVYKKALSS